LKFAKYSYLFILGLTFVFSVAIKISFIEAKELWLDETYTYFLISLPFHEMMHYIFHDVHPPLYYLFLKSWATVFGYSPYSLRAFSLVLSCLVPLFSFLTAKTIFTDKWNTLLCFLLVLFSTQLFYYSLEVRAYMLPLVFLSIFFYSYVKLLRSPDHNLFYVLFSFAGACSFFSHYFTLFIILPFFIHLLVFTFIDKLPVKKVAISVVLFSILTAPWLPVLLQQWNLRNRVSFAMASARQNPETLNYGFSSRINSIPNYLIQISRYLQNSAFGSYSPIGDHSVFKWIIWTLKLLFLGFIILALIRGDRIALLLAVVTAAYLIFVFITRKTLFVPRYFLFLSYFVPFFIGIAIHHMRSNILVRNFSLGIGFLIVVSSGISNIRVSNAVYCKQYMTTVQFFKENYRVGDQIVFHNLLEKCLLTPISICWV
jgi:uncharacterized membrane protein